MTTFDAGPQTTSGLRPPGWLSAALAEGRSLERDRVFGFHELSTFEPGCVSVARRFVDQTLGSWGAEQAVFDVQLIVSELVTNAMRHGGGAIDLRLLLSEAELACVVSDHSPVPPTTPATREADVFAEYGRGLRLVEALCGAWGWLTPGGSRKFVWAVLPV